MKKLLILCCFLISIHSAFSQSAKIDAMLKQLSAEKNDSTRIDLILNFFTNTAESDPVLSMQNAQKLLPIAKK